MKNKKIGNEIKWYKPFKLIKRIKQLESLTEEQFLIINNYSDELKELKNTIKNLEETIKSLKEDNKSLLAEIEVKPKKTRKTTTKKTTTKRKTTKKEEK